MSVYRRLQELHLQLPSPPKPVAKYVPYVITGNLLFISGQGPLINGIPQYQGKIGEELTVDEGREAARITGLNILSLVEKALEDLERVVQIVKVNGYVNCIDGFEMQPEVIDGASSLFIDVFLERGHHARTAVACNALPRNIPVEIEMVLQFKST